MRRVIAATCLVFAHWTTPGSAQAAEPNPQAIYDAAQAAFDKADWAGALDGFQTLLPSDPSRPLSHSQALIAGRLAFALEHLRRFDEALVIAKRAIGALPADDIVLVDTLMTAGESARYSFDYSASITLYERALALAKGAGDQAAVRNVRIALAYAETTINPVAVGVELDQALADKAALTEVKKTDLALIEDLRARAAANAGDNATAERWATRAVDDSGGLTIGKVSLLQIAIRNDAGIIASLRRKGDDARRYLAYTGAGHLKKMAWIGRFTGELPVCAEEADVHPSDSVIVQFSIADNGEVLGALPVYASRPGPTGAIFAQAVSTWHWDSQGLEGVELFWRNALVLELRCASRPTPIALKQTVRRALADWLTTKGLSLPPYADLVHADDPRLRSDGPDAIPALFARIEHNAQSDAVFTRLRSVLDAQGAPAAAYALMLSAQARAKASRWDYAQSGRSRAAYLAAVAPAFRTRYPEDPATAWLLLDWALAYEEGGNFKDALPVLQMILDLPRFSLPDEAPVRRVALLHKAMTANRLGDPSVGTHLAQSGLEVEQCSMFDTHPIPTSLGANSGQFPKEAQEWGFEGYVRESFDITADGKVANPRPVVAYPPLVFGPATDKVVSGFKFLSPRIGDKTIGCMGRTQGINYKLSGSDIQ